MGRIGCQEKPPHAHLVHASLMDFVRTEVDKVVLVRSWVTGQKRLELCWLPFL